MLVPAVAFIILGLVIIFYSKRRSSKYATFFEIPGPKAYPIIGNVQLC